jgi:hypothetical protein
MAPASLPVQVLRGLYLGVLTGIVPALVAWSLGFLFRYVTGITAPSFGIVVLGVAIAGVNGGFLAFNDPAIIQSANSVTLVTALLVVMMGCFYAHNRGDALGARAPRRFSLRGLKERTLSADVVDLVGGRGQVRIEVGDPVADMEGHPPLPETIRSAIAGFEARLPADLPMTELETRFADQLRGSFDLGDVDVTIDERGIASVAAAPAVSGVSKRVSFGERAVSIRALLPTGLDRGDEVTVLTEDAAVDGTVVSVGVEGSQLAEQQSPSNTGPEEGSVPSNPRRSGTNGGWGRLTIAVDRTDGEILLRASEGRVVVGSRGSGREFELASLLRRGGGRIRRLTVADSSPLADRSLGEADVRDAYGVTVLAIEHAGDWKVAPGGRTVIGAGDDIFVAGPRDAVGAFKTVVT